MKLSEKFIEFAKAQRASGILGGGLLAEALENERPDVINGFRELAEAITNPNPNVPTPTEAARTELAQALANSIQENPKTFSIPVPDNIAQDIAAHAERRMKEFLTLKGQGPLLTQ